MIRACLKKVLKEGDECYSRDEVLSLSKLGDIRVYDYLKAVATVHACDY